MNNLTELELRYLRKALRYRLGMRKTPPAGLNTGNIPLERRHELNKIADWVLQKKQ